MGDKEDSFQHHSFDIQGSRFFQTSGVFIDSPGRSAVFEATTYFAISLL